jgi:hypothetical protein
MNAEFICQTLMEAITLASVALLKKNNRAAP